MLVGPPREAHRMTNKEPGHLRIELPGFNVLNCKHFRDIIFQLPRLPSFCKEDEESTDLFCSWLPAGSTVPSIITASSMLEVVSLLSEPSPPICEAANMGVAYAGLAIAAEYVDVFGLSRMNDSCSSG
ncbi:hypothetical protein Nepgr_031286 [Nepenthes gracilis]|uniref:Uncharacterized protein n=1 Tax=Nepenthes gracilis TaxID=150966 RepID=A0AAD3Y509_NEPGR|nr:hypothetical protein Nepgr_031286 [Nepenthes gracilis]